MRAKPCRKAKSKGNHLKNLHSRIEIKNEYEQNHVILNHGNHNNNNNIESGHKSSVY